MVALKLSVFNFASENNSLESRIKSEPCPDLRVPSVPSLIRKFEYRQSVARSEKFGRERKMPAAAIVFEKYFRSNPSAPVCSLSVIVPRRAPLLFALRPMAVHEYGKSDLSVTRSASLCHFFSLFCTFVPRFVN